MTRRSSRLTRLNLVKAFLPCSLVALSLSLFSAPAQAQYYGGYGSGWIVDPADVSGMTATTSVTHADGTTYAPPPSIGRAYLSGVVTLRGDSASYQVSGTIKVTLTYHGADGSPATPPPDQCQVWVREEAGANWSSTQASQPPLSSISGSCSDGLGGTEVDRPDGTGGTSQYTKWEHKDGSSGTITVQTSPSASLHVSVPQDGTTSGGGVSCGLTVSIGDRCLITSPIETSYFKSTPQASETGEWYPALPHLRNADGSIQVDSAVGWSAGSSGDFGVPGTLRGWLIQDLPFSATTPFGDGTQYSWSVSGDGAITGPSDQQTVPFTLDEPSADNFPKHSTFQVTVTEPSSGATDSNTYDVTWHLPYEGTDVISHDQGKDIIATRASGVPPSGWADFSESEGGEFPAEVIADGGSLLASATGQPEIEGIAEVVGKIVGIINWLEKYQHEDSVVHGAENGPDTWAVAQARGNVTGIHANDPNGWLYCDMAWCRVAYWSGSHWYADKFNLNGFAGAHCILSGKQVDAVREEPYFSTDTTYQ